MALSTTTNVFQDSVAAAVKALFNMADKEVSQRLEYKHLGFTDYDIAIPNEQHNGVSGPGPGVLTLEGVEYGDVDKFRGFPITINPQKYTYKLSFTEEVVHWLQKASSTNMVVNEVVNPASDAVTALYQNVDTNAANTFYLGFGTTSSVNSNGTVGNSEALFGAHTLRRPGSTAQRNTFPTNDTHRPFSGSALRTSIDILNRLQGHNAVQLVPSRDLVVVCPQELAADVHATIKSDYGPLSPNLGINPVSENALASRGTGINFFVSSYIPQAYSTYWFVVARDRAVKEAKMGWAWRPRLTDEERKSSGSFNALGSVNFRPISLGWDWVFGSQGNNTTPS